MYDIAQHRLNRLINGGMGGLLDATRVGVEKEALRVTPEGTLSQAPHPRDLGSPLTHPHITTDYSEALTELITPPFERIADVLDFLRDTQRFVHAHLGDELLWATSMPCVVAGETSIPIARYGNSNAGMMKTVYRRGLGHRYGRVMQTIAGVHFNFSFADEFWVALQQIDGNRATLREFMDDGYFALIRNQQRFGWLVPYLFGASPAVCKSFLGGRPTNLESFDRGTYYGPYATSLRMGDIGYQNNKEAKNGIKACYDNLDAYVRSLVHAIETPCPEYEKIGVVVNGRYEQINANILQIENEYYSTIRPKQVVGRFEKPVHALKSRGVRYVELRSVDVNVFEPLGMDERQLLFLKAFLVFCLLHESPRINAAEQAHIDYNELAAAHHGRDPQLRLRRDDKEILLSHWALEILDAMAGVCAVLDGGDAARPYSTALAAEREKVLDPERTPSARMLAEMRAAGEGFFQYAMRLSRQHQAWFAKLELSAERRALFEQLAEQSQREQQELEAASGEPFDRYLERYFAQSV